MRHCANVFLVITKQDSKYVPFSLDYKEIVLVDSEGQPKEHLDETVEKKWSDLSEDERADENLYLSLSDDLELICTGHFPLPDELYNISFELEAHIHAELHAYYYSYETDCGREYDADFALEKVKIEYFPVGMW